MKCYAFLVVMIFNISFLYADILTLKNGDKFTGQVLEKKDESLSFKTDFGVLQIPLDKLESIVTSKEIEDARLATESKAVAAAKVSEETKSFIQNYQEAVHEFIPLGWEFKLRGGIAYTQTTSSSLAYSFAFDALKSWDELNELRSLIYYDYSSESPNSGKSFRIVDKCGANINYKRYLSENKTWFFNNTIAYEIDTIRGIKDQFDEIIGLGRTFKFIDDKIIMNASIGPAVRYLNSQNYDEHWIAMMTIMQDFAWRFHDYARFESAVYGGLQGNAFGGINVMDASQFNVVLNAGMIFELNSILHLAIRYSYNYNSINSSTAQKVEQRLIFGFELPFK